MGKLIDITGHVFGEWKVLERDLSKKGTYWICENIKTNEVRSIQRGNLIKHEERELSKKGRTWIVYKHTCPNDKSYIGITCHKDPTRRWGKNGIAYINNGTQERFSRAIKKYGWDNITHEILECDLSYKNAQSKEKYYIKLYNSYDNGYNMTLGGEHSAMLGKKHSDETKQKISKYFKGRFVGELNPMYGVHDNHICDENGKLPKYIKDKLSVKAKERIKIPKERDRLQSYNVERMKSVYKYDLNGLFLLKYNSLNEASAYENISLAQISKTCNKELQTHGFMFRFYGEDKNNIEPYSKRISSCAPKPVVVDNIIFNTQSMTSIYLNLSRSMLGIYLTNKKPMPQKWKSRGLRYYNPEIDKDLPIYVDTKNEV